MFSALAYTFRPWNWIRDSAVVAQSSTPHPKVHAAVWIFSCRHRRRRRLRTQLQTLDFYSVEHAFDASHANHHRCQLSTNGMRVLCGKHLPSHRRSSHICAMETISTEQQWAHVAQDKPEEPTPLLPRTSGLLCENYFISVQLTSVVVEKRTHFFVTRGPQSPTKPQSQEETPADKRAHSTVEKAAIHGILSHARNERQSKQRLNTRNTRETSLREISDNNSIIFFSRRTIFIALLSACFFFLRIHLRLSSVGYMKPRRFSCVMRYNTTTTTTTAAQSAKRKK